MYNNDSSGSNVGMPRTSSCLGFGLHCGLPNAGSRAELDFQKESRRSEGRDLSSCAVVARQCGLLVCKLQGAVGLKIGCNRYAAFASHLGVATNPDAVVLVGIVKPTSMPLSLTPFTKVTPTPLGSSTEV